MKQKLLAILLLCITITANAKVELPAFFADRMVLQQQSQNTIRGTAKANQKVSLKTSWDNKIYTTKSNEQGQFEITIQTPKAGGSYYMEFSDGEVLRLNDILIGELWLCSGQSNMEMPVKGFKGQPVEGSHQYIVKAKSETPIRMFTVKRAWNTQPQNNVTGEWGLHTPSNVAKFSATAYFFGQMLQQHLNVPIGLLHSSWSASNIETWMSKETLADCKEVDLSVLDQATFKNPNTTPTLLHNAMIYPLRGLAFKGIIWYQGESNSANPELYRKLFPLLAEQWRTMFKSPELPIYYVQLTPYQSSNKDETNLAEFRQVQLELQDQVAHTGMAITSDLGSEKFIHPPFKKEVGERLALWALNKTYHQDGFAFNGPTYQSYELEANTVKVKFNYAEDGLTPEKENVTGFEIADQDGVFVEANAVIVDATNTVKVWNDKVTNPTEVRYIFKNYTTGSLANNANLPAASFKIQIK